MNRKKLESRWRRGYGHGGGEDYKPWLSVADVSSKGRCSKVQGHLIDREYHFFSDLEKNYFTILEFMGENIVDINEQFPLWDLESTERLAKELNIRHPQDHGENVVMTSDFLITYRSPNGYEKAVRTVKPASELKKKRVLEKFALEEEWWARHKVTNWKIVTDREIDPVLAQNITDLREFEDLSRREAFSGYSSEELETMIERFLKGFTGTNSTVQEYCQCFEQDGNFKSGVGISIYKHLLIKKRLKTDLRDRQFGVEKLAREVSVC